MKPSDLSGAQRRLYDTFRESGMSEAAAMTATAGRRGALRAVDGFDALTDAFEAMGLSTDAARTAAVGRHTSEAEARRAHTVASRGDEDAAIVSTVRRLAVELRTADPALTEQAALARGCSRVREVFAGTRHAPRVHEFLLATFPPPASRPSPRAASAENQLREARRRGTGVRVVNAAGAPTGEVLTLAEIDNLLEAAELDRRNHGSAA